MRISAGKIRRDPQGADTVFCAAGGEFPVATGVFWREVVFGGVFCAAGAVGAGVFVHLCLCGCGRKGRGLAAAVHFVDHFCGVSQCRCLPLELVDRICYSDFII